MLPDALEIVPGVEHELEDPNRQSPFGDSPPLSAPPVGVGDDRADQPPLPSPSIRGRTQSAPPRPGAASPGVENVRRHPAPRPSPPLLSSGSRHSRRGATPLAPAPAARVISFNAEFESPSLPPRLEWCGELEGEGANPQHAGLRPQPARRRLARRRPVAVQFVLNYEEGGENNVLHGDAASEAFLPRSSAPARGRRAT